MSNIVLALLVFATSSWILANAVPLHCPTLNVNNIYVHTTSKRTGYILARSLPGGSREGIDLYISQRLPSGDRRWCTLVTTGVSQKALLSKGSKRNAESFNLFLSSSHNVRSIANSLSNNSLLTYSCSNGGNEMTTSCFRLHSNYFSGQASRTLSRRSIDVSPDVVHSSNFWNYSLIGLLMGVVLLTMIIAICVGKDASKEQNPPPAIGNLNILSGPPPEYFNSTTAPPKSVTLPRDVGSESPSRSIGKDLRSLSISPDNEHRRKLDTPLPDIPNVAANERTNGSVDRTDSPKPGGYSEVIQQQSESRADSAADNYFEIRQIDGRRSRSSTDPVEPVLSPMSVLPRSYTGVDRMSHDHLPLPLPPRNFEGKEEQDDDTYDSIDEVKSRCEKKKSTEEELGEDDNEMYESVPEDFREELRSLSSPVGPPPPVFQINETSPSKGAVPGSPGKRKLVVMKDKGSRKKNRPESVNTEDDKHRLSFFNRKRASSASSAIKATPSKDGATGKKDDSPHHDLPLPPEPLEDEDDDDTYDSVQEMSKRSTTFSSARVNEPLPEVPEDSGSGSAASVVKRNRELDVGDPNYDTVSSTLRENRRREPDYDEVKQKAAGGKNEPPKMTHNYAKVTSHSQPSSEVSHDSLGYAVVNSSVVEQKRTMKNEDKMEAEENEEEEDPYAKIKLGGEEEQEEGKEEEDPYDNIKLNDDEEKEEEEEDPYDNIKLDDEDIEDEDPYAKIPLGDDEDQTDPANQIEAAGETSMEEGSSGVPTNDLPTGTVATDEMLCEDEMYARVDPDVVHRKRATSMKLRKEEKEHLNNSSSINDDGVSPVPSIPPVGDLGDISDLSPPPIPQQLPNLSENESTVASEVSPDDGQEPRPNQVPTQSNDQDSSLRNSVQSSSSSDGGVPVYDSLDTQQPLYDSLEPQEANVYDKLQPDKDEESIKDSL